MALVSEVRAACPAPVAADEPNEKTAPEEVAHDACGGVDEHGRPWPAPYYLHDGLRRVPPYHFTYNTWVKGRWRNRGILDVFTSEFRDRTEEYYKGTLEAGDIRVNGKVVGLDAVLKNGDLITHAQHRHEPPVTAAPIAIVHEDDAMMVIDKPAGVPVHPAGRYFHNSVVEIMRAERRGAPGGPVSPHPCNRLDRLTSGIMFIAKTPRGADNMALQLKRRTLRKEYIARVAGEFPEGSVVCDQPVLVISPKLGLNAVRASGKQAVSVFKRLAYYPPSDDPSPTASSSADAAAAAPSDGMDWKRWRGHSIVRCFPLTGRTHQLRVHLQFLGHPIANDPIYANRRVFGAALGRGRDSGSADEDIITALSRMGKDEVADAVAYHDGIVDDFLRRRAERLTGELCDECDAPLYSDPGEHEMGMYLHARRYEDISGAWAYETKGLPAWAMPPEGREGPRECGRESEPLDIDFDALKIEEDIPLSKTEKDRLRQNGDMTKG